MVEISIGEHKIKLYSSIKELPINNNRDLNKYALIKMGKGNTIDDLVSRFQRLDQFIGAGKNEDAARELYNLYQGMFDALNDIDHTSLMFALMVHSIDDEKVVDYSEDNLPVIIDRCNALGLTAEMVQDNLNELKKNLIPN